MSSASTPAGAPSSDVPLYEQYLKEKDKYEALSTLPDSSCLGQIINRKMKIPKSDENPPTEENVGPNSSSSPRESYEDLIQSGQTPPEGLAIGFENEELWLVRSIIKPAEENFKAIGIVGMPQLGKTELCGLVFNNEFVKQYFAPRIWVEMSEKRSQLIVAEMILKQLDVEDNLIDGLSEHGIGGMIYAIYLKLVGKRYLIVLDDVQDGIDKGGFASAFPKGSGGAVIVTARKRSVAEKIVGTEEKGENIYFPQPIADPDKCWEIYDYYLKGEVKNPTEDLKKEVRKKSGGHPLAVKLMAEIKKEQMKNEQRGEVRNDKKAEQTPKESEDEQGKEGKVDPPVPKTSTN